MFVFEPDYIVAPEPGDDDQLWRFSQDLRQFFPALHSNHEIGDLLVDRGVVNKAVELDSESSCTWAYFKTEKSALAFLKRLNAIPEVKTYVTPNPFQYAVVPYDDWAKLKEFLTVTLTKKQYKALLALETKIETIG